MAKANINLPNGTKITIDGTKEEISEIIQLYSTGESKSSSKTTTKKRKYKKGVSKQGKLTKKISRGPKAYIRELKEDNYFVKKRSINDVQKKLEESGHIYPTTHLSAALIRLVKDKALRRMKEDGSWVYVNI